MKHILVVAMVFLVADVARAVPESELPTRFDAEVWPYFQQGHQGFMLGKADVPLHYVSFPRDDDDAAIVFLPGRGEFTTYYAELVHDLRDKPWSFYILDERGQGESGRLLSDPHKGHVEAFDWYTDDVKRFFDEVVHARPHRKIILMGHSMGGCIASLFAEQYPDEIDGLVLVTPMNQANYKPYTEEIAALIAVTNVLEGRHEVYAINQSDPKDPPDFDKQKGTHSRARFDITAAQEMAHEDIRTGGVTYGWAHESVKGARKSRAEAFKATMPVLLFQAGKDETVMATGQDAFCSRAPDCHKVELPGSFHNPLRETDDIRDKVLGELRVFVDGVEAPSDAQGCTQSGPAPWACLVVIALFLRRRVK